MIKGLWTGRSHPYRSSGQRLLPGCGYNFEKLCKFTADPYRETFKRGLTRPNLPKAACESEGHHNSRKDDAGESSSTNTFQL